MWDIKSVFTLGSLSLKYIGFKLQDIEMIHKSVKLVCLIFCCELYVTYFNACFHRLEKDCLNKMEIK